VPHPLQLRSDNGLVFTSKQYTRCVITIPSVGYRVPAQLAA
jgi:hypothetical protein